MRKSAGALAARSELLIAGSKRTLKLLRNVRSAFAVRGKDHIPDHKLVVEAVIGEPVSATGVPCFAGIYRENSAFDADMAS
jgi:hypothetical protein